MLLSAAEKKLKAVTCVLVYPVNIGHLVPLKTSSDLYTVRVRTESIICDASPLLPCAKYVARCPLQTRMRHYWAGWGGVTLYTEYAESR